MSTNDQGNKVGGALVMAMLIVVVYAILAMGLLKLYQIHAVETVYHEQHRRAFWMAEAGLEKVRDRLQWDRNFRYDPASEVPYTVNFTNGVHTNDSYKIASISTTLTAPSGMVYQVQVVGYAGNLNRRIQQTFFGGLGGPNALRAITGDIMLNQNVDVIGDVYVDVGDATIRQNVELDGYLMMGSGSVEGPWADTVDLIEAPPPPVPSVDLDFWTDPYLDTVRGMAPTDTNGLSGVTNVVITGTPVYNSYTSMVATNPITISGSAVSPDFNVWVSSTDTTFDNWTVLMPLSMVIIDGNVQFDQQVEYQDNIVVFATGDIYVRQASDASTFGATLIALGNIELEQNLVFKGLIFAGGTVDVGSNAEISGTIIAGGGIDVASNAEITYNPDVFLQPLPGLNDITNDVHFIAGTWTELAPE